MKKNLYQVSDLFDSVQYPVLNEMELQKLFLKIRGIYGFKSLSREKMTQFLLDSKLIAEENMLAGNSGIYRFYRLVDREADLFDFAAARSRSSYISHYSALSIHNLTMQIPKHIYMTNERNSSIYRSEGTLSQEAIDNAFSKDPRQSSNLRTFRGNTIHYLNGQGNNRLGVTPYKENLAVTDVERTLIDVVARPFYAGGVTQVLEAFDNAREMVDAEKLYEYYVTMKFVYPYHQAIGFYMERTGYNNEAVAPFLQMEQQFKFYLSYNIRSKDFSERWNLYFPKGL